MKKPENYNDTVEIENETRNQARRYYENLINVIEDVFYNFMYTNPWGKKMDEREYIIYVNFLSSYISLKQGYESSLRKYFGVSLILVRSAFESLMHNFFLLLGDDEKINVYLKYLGKINLDVNEKRVFKKCRKFNPVFFREYFYKEKGNLESINEYYRGLSDFVHEPWTGIRSILTEDFNKLHDILLEITNLQIWHILVCYEEFKVNLKGDFKTRLGQLLSKFSKLGVSIYDLGPNGFRTSQKIIDEIVKS